MRSAASRGVLFFFFLLIVTFSKQMELRGRTEGENGDLSEKIFRDFCNEGSAKEGEVTGLRYGVSKAVWTELVRGGKSKSENKEGGETFAIGRGGSGDVQEEVSGKSESTVSKGGIQGGTGSNTATLETIVLSS